MGITVSYPGVYVDEDGSPAPSIYHSPTAVPAIVVPEKDALLASVGDILRVDSWLDYVNKFRSIIGTSMEFDNTDNGMRNSQVRAYFEIGGGYCYLVNASKLTAAIPAYDDITLLVASSYDISSAVSTLCTPGSGIFAIGDGPNSQITSSYKPDFASTPCMAVYYPYLLTDWSAHSISPSVVAAAIYCKVDRTRGVWKAPANVYIPASYSLRYTVTDDLQGLFNQGTAINMIRQFGTNGPCIWGARTLEDSDNWRYISVRRLFDSAERDIKKSLNGMMFEPNNQPTWEKVRSAINNYLYGLWQAGALAGDTEKDAYFVQIGDGVTMNADDIAAGKMIVKVGMAAVRPAEFIILEFSQNMSV